MNELQHKIEQALQTVYDPDFPVVDIYTLGLIYDVAIEEQKGYYVVYHAGLSYGGLFDSEC